MCENEKVSLAPLVRRYHHVRAVGRGDEDVQLPEAVGEAVEVADVARPAVAVLPLELLAAEQFEGHQREEGHVGEEEEEHVY